MRAEIQNNQGPHSGVLADVVSGSASQSSGIIATVTDDALQKRLAEHRAMKASMIAEEEKKHFSYDVKC